MGLKKIKQTTLSGVLLKQFLSFVFCVILDILIFVLLFYFGLGKNIILPANYAQQVLEQNKDIIAKSMPFDATKIPFTCKYGLFDLEENYIIGNLNQESLENAKEFLDNPKNSKKWFYFIERENEYCVIQYDFYAHFRSPFLHQIIPKPEILFIILFMILFIITLLAHALRLSKTLKKELEPLLKEVEKIQEKELEMNTSHSKIKEYDDILCSLDDMKMALSNSLEAEWRTEQTRKSHISALAHDIRTPLTIIKGNAELISEENKLNQIYVYTGTINHNIGKIERYINLLIEATKHEFIVAEHVEQISLQELISNISTQAKNLCKAKDMRLIVKNPNIDKIVKVDIELISRAILNIVKNAIEHSFINQNILLSFEYADKKLSIMVEDFGTGFTEEALKYATNQFYTNKKERANENYGLGMYIASKIAKTYQGEIKYYNKSDQSGAVVIITIML